MHVYVVELMIEIVFSGTLNPTHFTVIEIECSIGPVL